MIWWLFSHAIMNLKAAMDLVIDRHLQCTIHSQQPTSHWINRKDFSAGWHPMPREQLLKPYIWSHGIRCGPASSSGLGSLTKMSPLQVTDQMACREGGPWIRLLSQHDMVSKDSYKTRSRELKASIYSENKHFHIDASVLQKEVLPLHVLANQQSEFAAFSQKALEFSVLDMINAITDTNVFCSIWSLWSIFWVFHCFTVYVPACLPTHKTLQQWQQITVFLLMQTNRLTELNC